RHCLAWTLPLNSPVYLFLLSADHLDLPSFPTRRSSDLPEPHSGPAGWHSWPISQNRVGFSSRVFPQGLRCQCVTASRTAVNVLRDRKSTRLNSSHVKISYAVFCLKKIIGLNFVLIGVAL